MKDWFHRNRVELAVHIKLIIALNVSFLQAKVLVIIRHIVV